MAVAGLRGTGDWGTDERPKNFRESILWMEPNGDSPLLALSSKVKGKSKSVNDPDFSWWCEPMEIIRLQVNGAVGGTVGDTLITVDSSDPSAAAIKTNYGTARHLVPGDVLMVEPTADTASDTAERVIVTQVHSDLSFSVQRGASGTSAAVIANDAFLLHVGSVFGEGTAEPQSTTRNPLKFNNLTQIFKTSYELTNSANATLARTGDTLANDKKRRMFDHSKAMEMALMFGRKFEDTDANGKPRRFMSGLRQFIPTANTTILAANWGLLTSAAPGNNLIDAISPVFDYSSPAGNTRIGLCGNGALNAINKAIGASSGANGVNIYWGQEKKLWGMEFRELVFPQGRVLLKTHPLMSRHALYTNSMWLMDFSALTYVSLAGRDTKSFDDIQAKGEDLKRGQWLTECSLMVDFGGQTLGYIGGFGSAVA